jgi:primosomal protein N''
MDNLLDTAVRLQRIDDFSAFLREAHHLLPRWADDLSEHRLNTIDMMLEHGSVGAPRREELEAERQRIHRQQDYDRRLRDRLEEMRFGIAAWLLKLVQEKPDDEPYKKMLSIVLSSLPQDMQGFTHTYVHCSRREVDDFWGWFRHQDMSEEHAVAFRPTADADHLFCVRILQLLAEPDTAKQDGIELPLSSHLAAESSPEGGLTKLLNEIDANRKSWAAVLSDSAMEQVPRLRRMLADVIVRQEVETRRKLIDSSISDRRVNEFFAELVAEYEKDAQLKHILSELLLYKDLRGTPPSRHVERRGINTIADKALFVENWPEGRIGFAEHYGQGLAVGEAYDAWSVLETDPRTRRGELDGFLLELQSASGNGRPFVIVGGDAEYWLNQNAPSSFIPKWRNSQPSSHPSTGRWRAKMQR